jgi:uncharacterized damage-inducible protein DinB
MFPTLECRADILKMLDELTEHRTAILDRCSKLTHAQLRDPVYTGTWSLLQNFTHLAWAEAYMLAWIKKRPEKLPEAEWPHEPGQDLAEIRKAFDEAHAAVIAFLKSNPEAALKESCLYGRKATQQTVGGVLFHLVEHEIHHRCFIKHKLEKLESKS